MPDESGWNELTETRTSLMNATAKLVAHYVATAVQAGLQPKGPLLSCLILQRAPRSARYTLPTPMETLSSGATRL